MNPEKYILTETQSGKVMEEDKCKRQREHSEKFSHKWSWSLKRRGKTEYL